MTRRRCFPQELWCIMLIIGKSLFVGAEEFIDPLTAMVTGNGYPLEVHFTMTTDGYILGMHRIPFGVKSPAAPNKPVAFLMHPIYCTSYSYTWLGKDHSLAFILADAGYDVWLGNTRGNVYARSNIYVSPKSSAFWDFSWHERGTFDLPAMIDYVLQETNQEKLSYVSHSRGCTMFFVLMSIFPEYNDKIEVSVHMAPNVFMTHPHKGFEEVASHSSRLLEWILLSVGINELKISSAVIEILDADRCQNYQGFGGICEQMLFLTGSFDSKRINETKKADIRKDSIVGVSIKEMAHFGQLVTSKRFAMYDYSFIGNLARYGSPIPPSYDLAKVTAPVVIVNSKYDIFATTMETDVLVNALPNVVKHILIEEPGFTHGDFFLSDDAKMIVYDKILAQLGK